jgi:Zn-dependent protease with chaperone function
MNGSLPRPNNDGSLLTWNQTQARYDARIGRFLLFLLQGPLILAVVLVVNAALPPDDPRVDGFLLPLYILLGSALLIGVSFQVVVGQKEVNLGRAIPGLASAATPPKIRVVSILSLALPLLLVVIAISLSNVAAMFTMEGVGIVLLILRGRLLARYLVTQRVRLPEDDPLVIQTKEAFEREGITPKHFVVTRSTVGNAFVLQGGIVMITAGMRWLLSNEEIVAIIVHELSHYRDKDIRKLQSLRTLATLVILGLQLGALYVLLPTVHESMIGPGLVGVFMISSSLTMPIVGRFSRRLEFKCDAATFKSGHNLELASGLDKLARYMGHPYRWSKLHGFLLTHPSYAERLTLLDPNWKPE